eukprot:9605582-Karenia_brevis.AAC.1
MKGQRARSERNAQKLAGDWRVTAKIDQRLDTSIYSPAYYHSLIDPRLSMDDQNVIVVICVSTQEAGGFKNQ